MRGRWKNRKDTNQSEIVEGLRAAGFTVYVQDRPCDLLVGKPGQVDPVFVDTKTLDGKKTPAQKRFDAQFPGVIHYWRSLTECLIGLGKVTPVYNYRIWADDGLVGIEMNHIADSDVPSVLALIKDQKGVGTMTGLNAYGEIQIWPKKGCKLDALAKRIDRALDQRRIANL